MNFDSITQAIVNSGRNPETTKITAILRHIHFGQAPSMTSPQRVLQIFQPITTEIALSTGEDPQPFMTIKWPDTGLAEGDLYWQQICATNPIQWDQARALAQGLVLHHRMLTGELKHTFDLRESDDREINKIRNRRDTLCIGYQHITQYLELSYKNTSHRLQALFDRKRGIPPNEVDILALEHQAASLTHTFIKHPCDINLFGHLLSRYRDGGHTGIGFNDYYNWFRESTEKINGKDLSPSFKEQLTGFVQRQTNTEPSQCTYWACRNFNIHPEHEHLVEAFIENLTDDANRDALRTQTEAAR